MAPPPIPPPRQAVVLTERPGWDQQQSAARDKSPQVPKAKWGPKVPENPSVPEQASGEASGSQAGTSQHR
eukprot:4099673-Amphidinium_carterae.1